MKVYKVKDKRGIKNRLFLDSLYEDKVLIKITRDKKNGGIDEKEIIIKDRKGYHALLFDKRAGGYCRNIIKKMGLKIVKGRAYTDLDNNFIITEVLK